jgi:hypothetical protein
MNENNVQKHTQEPWGYDVNGVITGGQNLCTSICVTSQHQWERKEGLGTWLGDQHRKQLVSESKANAKRIVECVNACKGIENPNTIPAILAERDRLQASNAELLAALKFLLKEFDQHIPETCTCHKIKDAACQARAAIANAEKGK